jgi:GNAT superfamily N-acetyltransferase
MEPETFAVRRMRADELGMIGIWAAQEGWNPGVHDAAAFFAADPHGFFVGELDGKPVSCISCIAYDDEFGFLGQYIVHPAAQGRGYGVQTWAAGMAHLGGRNVGLDGVLNQQSNYERSGFHYAYQHVRHEGTGGGVMPERVVKLSAVPFDDVVAYDRTCFPAARPEFLRRWIALPNSAAFAVVADGALRGYGVIRRSVGGHKIGPLFADNAVVAERLLRALWAMASDEMVCIDIPDGTFNPTAEGLLQPFGTRELFRTARMYTHQMPVLATGRIFGITTMELG